MDFLDEKTGCNGAAIAADGRQGSMFAYFSFVFVPLMVNDVASFVSAIVSSSPVCQSSESNHCRADEQSVSH